VISVAAAGLLVVLWRLRPPVPSGRCAPDVDVVRGCALLAWTIAGYLALIVTVCALCRLRAPGRAPRATRLLPGVLRRRVDTAIRAGIVSALLGLPALPTAALASTPAGARPPSVVHCDASAQTPVVAAADDPLDWPGLTGTPAPATTATPRTHHPDVGLVMAGRGRPAPTPGGGHVVAAGDTLWSIARADLSTDDSAARITTEWHRWYVTNRAEIGTDPDLIRPGQRLRAPTAPPPTPRDTSAAPTSAPTSDPRSPQ
jgi:nucleoid-associated protein YgaU